MLLACSQYCACLTAHIEDEGDVAENPAAHWMSSRMQHGESAATAMQAILTEVARVRAYGFSERELKYTRDYLLSDYESLYVERDQAYAQV